MANDISITVRGFVGKEPNITRFPDGGQLLTFRLGSTPRYRDRKGVWQSGQTQWFSVRARGALAENAKQSLSSGTAVMVHGRLVEQRWEHEGAERVSHTVIADAMGVDLNFGTVKFTRVRYAKRDEDNAEASGQSDAGHDIAGQDNAGHGSAVSIGSGEPGESVAAAGPRESVEPGAPGEEFVSAYSATTDYDRAESITGVA